MSDNETLPKPVGARYMTNEDVDKWKAEYKHSLGLVPLKLERDVLLRRVAEGGWSGDFLADAYISAYSGEPFNWRLDKLISLDGEGFRLFHEILHIRHIENWNDEEYYKILKDVKAAVEKRKEQESS